MEQLILCSGKYADTPFFLEEECIHLYSIEELCYYMVKNAWLLEPEFVSEALLKWIAEELKLPQLAADLGAAFGKKKDLPGFMEVLIRQTDYYEEDKLEWIQRILQNHSSMTTQEKKKCRADSYLKNKRFLMAADEYEMLLRETDETQSKLRAKLYHNLGVCASSQFLYKRAAELFKQAYDTYANTESYVQYLSALKLSLSEKEYLSFLAGNPQSYEDSLEVENRIRCVRQEWENGDTKGGLSLWNREDEEGSIYEVLLKRTEECKEEYRNITYRSSLK